MENEWKSKLHAQVTLGYREEITLKDAIDQYCESRRDTPNHRGLLLHTKVVLRNIPGSKLLHDLTGSDLERLKNTRIKEGRSPQTIKHSLNLVSASLKRARKMGYRVAEIQMPGVKLSKHRLRYLSSDEEKRLLTELDPQRESTGLQAFNARNPLIKQQMQDAYDLVVLLLDTGARYSEIANIEWSRIDLNTLTINLWRPKVQNETIVFMTERVAVILQRRFESKTGPHVFSNKRGRARGYAPIAIRKAIKRAGLHDCCIHTLRHTNASRLVQNGLSVYEVREMLGHTDIKTTMRYAHLEQRQVASRARDLLNVITSSDI